MTIRTWLHHLRSALTPARTPPRQRRRGAPRAAPHRLAVEALEDRTVPSFSPAASHPVAANPQAVVAGDFNNDGRLDLATARADAATVSVLLGNGAGGFGAAIHSSFPSRETNRISLTVADFDNDGSDDLAFTVYNPDTYAFGNGVGILMSNGDGTFGALNDVGTASYALAVAAGDFDNDGNSDLVVGGDDGGGLWGISTGFVQVLLGNGHGGFTPMSPNLQYDWAWNTELAVGDFNGDGNLDAATTLGEYGYSGFALLGDGTGRFTSRFDFGTIDTTAGVAVGDFNGDGTPDLIVAGVSGGRVETSAGRGDGTFDPSIENSTNAPGAQTGVAVADFNGDGRLDAVTSDPATNAARELRGNGNGTLTFAAAHAVGSSPSAIVVGDFNGDGRPDAATADAGSGTVSVLLNNGTWTPPPPPPPPPPRLKIGDVTVTEGNTGTRTATFTVTLSAASTQPVTVAYATGNGTATAGSDYQSTSGTLTFAPGQKRLTITVLITGDRLPEPHETFVVNLSSPTNATVIDGQGVGTILDDEPRVSIGDVSKAEGRKGQTTLFTFTVTLSVAYDQPVTMSFRTANGTATTGNGDYVAKTGTLTFAPGETTKTITIEVKGDNKREATESFSLDLFDNSPNSLFTKSRGIGTILNDD